MDKSYIESKVEEVFRVNIKVYGSRMVNRHLYIIYSDICIVNSSSYTVGYWLGLLSDFQIDGTLCSSPKTASSILLVKIKKQMLEGHVND